MVTEYTFAVHPGSCSSRTPAARAEKATSPNLAVTAGLPTHTWVSAMRENSMRVITGEGKPSGVGAQLSSTVSLWKEVARDSDAAKGAGASWKRGDVERRPHGSSTCSE